MTDLIVVGAGVAGSVLTRMARQRGLSVLLIDRADGASASGVALAVMRGSWHRDTAEAADWYRSIRALSATAATMSRWNAPPTAQAGWCLVDPERVLVSPDLVAHVIDSGPGRVRTRYGLAGLLEAPLVVLSHPVWTDDPPKSWGATAYSETSRVIGGPLRVHWLRPYHAIMAAWSPETGTRVGSSVEDTPSAALARASRMVSEATEAGLVTPAIDWRYRVGARWALSAPVVEPGLVKLGGLGRVGYTLAPALARAVLDGGSRVGLG